jgi:hypothetical protein
MSTPDAPNQDLPEEQPVVVEDAEEVVVEAPNQDLPDEEDDFDDDDDVDDDDTPPEEKENQGRRSRGEGKPEDTPGLGNRKE